MKVSELFNQDAQLAESQGGQMKKHATALKREGDLQGYHSQMIKYCDNMLSAEDRNLSSSGRFSMSGKLALKNIAKFEKEKLKHRTELKALREDYSSFVEADDGILTESNVDVALKNKAEKTGIKQSILRAVLNRGLAAWRQHHRPGVGQIQWALGRVNSFITGEGQARKADADLWAKRKD